MPSTGYTKRSRFPSHLLSKYCMKSKPGVIHFPSLYAKHRQCLASTNNQTPKGTIGSIHISCLYHFAITLVTRPILISTFADCSVQHSPLHSQLASACLNASVYFVQACHEAYKAHILLGNMCIMKALLFAVGLVLGFDMFAKRETNCSIETAFRQAREVLDFLGV
ncbi:hypothetical protein P153DRAFT_365047 [Dothidotthia symphoricarpi CBS 119687]|uniref:Uncharacterized protein n=1 Tax=Dothidotthia symphoricarpi CBS 119687 TaxID=1392245 RepID=A0A6A6ALW1_9PLEO|nr:uncharacterized protein P153DRAFT_365047 [Dothidotthia symphoricarpi CBS 119687]KAF2131461.1 hypothetical protein P153DRAFT_365047 [Dothidotthia symphoricarpi CBS 119687]